MKFACDLIRMIFHRTCRTSPYAEGVMTGKILTAPVEDYLNPVPS